MSWPSPECIMHSKTKSFKYDKLFLVFYQQPSFPSNKQMLLDYFFCLSIHPFNLYNCQTHLYDSGQSTTIKTPKPIRKLQKKTPHKNVTFYYVSPTLCILKPLKPLQSALKIKVLFQNY